MKISVSLSAEDIGFVDAQTAQGAFPSRSAAIQAGLRLLRDRQHVDSYAAAWDEWEESADSELWESIARDGLR